MLQRMTRIRQLSSQSVCAQCSQQPHTKHSLQKRVFSSTHHVQQSSSESSRQTYYDLFPETFSKGPPPQSPFTPDLRILRKEFLQLQAKAHPDLVAPEQKRQAEATSATINEAYKTLQDPLSRARYLLSLQDVNLEDDSMKLGENALLMEVMEAREAVDEVESEIELEPLKEENEVRIQETIAALERCFAAGDVQNAAQHAIRLRYWHNIRQSIHDWGRDG